MSYEAFPHFRLVSARTWDTSFAMERDRFSCFQQSLNRRSFSTGVHRQFNSGLNVVFGAPALWNSLCNEHAKHICTKLLDVHLI